MGWARTLFDRAPLFARTLPRPGRIAGVSVTAARFVRDTTLLSLAAVGPALAHEPGVFIVENPRVWIEEESAIVLVTLVNKEDKRVQIVGGISPAAKRVELRLRTKAVASIEVAAHGSLKLAPGGYTTARQVGRKVYGGQTSHLPLKLNMAGVIPPIFASSIILFPATLAGWFGVSEGTDWLMNIAATLQPGQPIYMALYGAAVIFFCFFHTALVFNPKETAENLKKSGAFVPGIRPGDQTARYIEKIMMRLTLTGAIYVTLVVLLPEFLIVWKNVPFYFGGTSLLIVVVVTMDFMAQVQDYMMSHRYESLLKKANFKGGGLSPR